jgi:intein/homing endonuclease
MRLINNAKALFSYDKGVMVDISPTYILDIIEKLSKDLYINKNNLGNKFMNILLRCYLSPKKVICEYKFSKIAFDHVIQQIQVKFHEAIAHPSEMVGVIAAQSIGEPSTQMSGDSKTIIRVTGPNNFAYSGPIGKFIDSLLKKHKTKVIKLENHKDSVVLDLENDYHIIGVSNKEKTSWKRISQISRHPANGGMVKVSTRSGKTTTATLSHSFLKRVTTGIEAIKGADLKVGDRIPVAKHINEVENPLMFFEIGQFGDIELSNDFGWLCGVYIADGSISGNKINISKIIPEYYTKVENIVACTFDKQTKQCKRERANFKNLGYDRMYESCDTYFTDKHIAEFLGKNFGIGSENKGIPAWVYGANKEFIAGLLQGYFDGDGNVNGDGSKSMIRAGSISEQLIDDIIVLLAYFDIFASKCMEISRTTKENVFHTIQISRKYGKLFKESIGLTVIEKANALDKLIEYVQRTEKHNEAELIDKIPCLGETIASIGKDLELPGQSRNYGRWVKKESIGRKTLSKYIEIFEKANETKKLPHVTRNIDILKQAAESDVIWDEIVHLEYLDDPKEYVYDFTVPGNDSFMVDTCILVHNTLNSVEWHTEILINNNNNLERVKIGEFIDKQIEELDKSQLEYHPNDTTLGWTRDKNFEILSCDEDGKISWKLIEAVTKHPPINEDGTNTLVKVITKSGREVIATKAKSFLKRENNKIVPVRGEDIRVGDYLPVSAVLPTPQTNKYKFDKLGYEMGHSYGFTLTQGARIPVVYLNGTKEFLQGILDGCSKGIDFTGDLFEDIRQIQTVVYGMDAHQDNIIPNVVTEEFGEISIPRAKLPEFITNSTIQKDKELYKNIMEEDIIYDQVVQIENVESTVPYVYDFTVKDTRNFNVYNGLCMRDTFHLSGVSSASKAVRGVPRIKELLSVTKNIKSPALTIHIDSKHKTDKKKCKEILNSIETTYFTDIVDSVKIYYDPNDFDTTIEEDKEFIESYKDFLSDLETGNNTSPWLLRFEFSKEKMLEYDIRMIDIYHTIQDFYDYKVTAMFSDDNAKKLVFRIKIVEEDEEEKDMITELKALEKNIMENLILKGIKKINKVSMSKKEFFEYDDEQMNFQKTFEWVLETNGSNLIDILCHPNVDNTRTISNNINEIYEILGIEAARQALYNEIWDVIKDADLYVNYRHLALLVDTMTNKGHLLSIDRHGINRGDVGPLAKSSFEETTDMLIKAGIFSEIDKINGVSANIMLGQIPPCGTGDTEIIIDEDKLQKLGTIQEEEDENNEDEFDTSVCTLDNLTFDFTLPEKDTNLVKKDIKFNII